MFRLKHFGLNFGPAISYLAICIKLQICFIDNNSDFIKLFYIIICIPFYQARLLFVNKYFLIRNLYVL